MNKIIRRAGLVLLPFLIFFIVGEAAVRVYLKFNTFYDVEMSRYSLLMKADAVDPRIGHVHRPAMRAKLMGVSVNINSQGFRDREYPLEKGGAYRIVFLGDSLTFGWGVEQGKLFADLLEKEISKRYPLEIINFAAGNYNTEQQTHLFLQKGLAYKPDKVVLFYFINDAEPTPVKSKWAFLGHSHLITFYWSRMHALLANLSPSKSFTAYYRSLYQDGQPGWEKLKKSFALLKEACDQNSIDLHVVFLPELHQLNPYPFENEYGKVKWLLDGLEIPYFDTTPSFAAEKDPISLWVAVDDAHPNARAHEIIANSALDYVAKR